MSHHDLLFTAELMRAFGVDVKLPQDEVFPAQLRPTVEFLHTNLAGTGPGEAPALRVVVPPEERWVMDIFVARGVEDQAAGFDLLANYYLSVYDGDLVGKDALPKRSGADVSIRTVLALLGLKTQERAGLQEWTGFKNYLNFSNAGGEFYTHGSPITLYGNQVLYFNSDSASLWNLGDELEVRARYVRFPQTLLNFDEAPRGLPLGKLNDEPGVWGQSKNGVFT